MTGRPLFSHRMKRHLRAFALIAFAVAAPLAGAVEKPAAAAPAPAAKTYAPTDLDGLRAAKGQTVAVEGTIVKQGESKTATVRYLNFTEKHEASISLVFFVSKGAGDFTKEKLTNFVGKKVRVTGVVGEYNDAPQIEIRGLDQLKLIP